MAVQIEDTTVAALKRRIEDLDMELNRLKIILDGPIGPGRGLALAKCAVMVDRAADVLAKHNDRLEG